MIPEVSVITPISRTSSLLKATFISSNLALISAWENFASPCPVITNNVFHGVFAVFPDCDNYILFTATQISLDSFVNSKLSVLYVFYPSVHINTVYYNSNRLPGSNMDSKISHQ